MKKVKITNINNYVVTFKDTDDKEYKKNIEFQDTEISEGDIIYISEEILDEDNIYTYGPLTNLENIELDDVIKIIKDDKEIYLQRYYG